MFNCCLERLRRKRPEPRRQRRRCSSLHTRLHPLSTSPPDLSFSSPTLLKGPRSDAPHPVQNMPTSPPPPSDNRQLYQPAQRRQSRLPASRCSQSKAFKLPCRGPKWRSRFSTCHTDADAFGRINKHRGSLWVFFSLSDQTFIFEALTNTIFSNKTKSSEKIFTEFFNCCISSQK